MPATNPHESLARTRKATAIADGIWTLACEDSPPREDLAEFVAGLPQEHRDALARTYGQREPSEETWAEVVQRLRTLLELRRTIHQLHEAAHA